eukprot:476673_1
MGVSSNGDNTYNCETSSLISRNVTIVYGSTYGLLLLIVSIYSFNFLIKFDETFINASSLKRFKMWLSDAWKRKRCYVPLVAHLFDQITDFAIAIQFYILAQQTYTNNWEVCNGLNIWYLFILTTLSMAVYRVVSSYLLYHATKSLERATLQMLDLELFRTLYINYICNKIEPCDPQRWLTALEAALESSPQTLIQLIYLVKAGTFNGNYLVVVSLVSSFWSIISKLVSDDKVTMTQKAQRADTDFTIFRVILVIIWLCIYLVICAIIFVPSVIYYVCCCRHFDRFPNCLQLLYVPLLHFNDEIIKMSYELRMIWRILDVSSHILLMGFIWLVMGGTALTIKVVFECLLFGFVCFQTKQWELLFGLVAMPISNNSFKFIAYRLITSTVFMILISIWLYIDFECWRCTKYIDRKYLSESAIIGVFIYLWCAHMLNTLCVHLLTTNSVFQFDKSASRTLQTMIDVNNIDGILEMQIYAENYGVYDEKNNKTLLMLAMRKLNVAAASYLLNKKECTEYDEQDANG